MLPIGSLDGTYLDSAVEAIAGKCNVVCISKDSRNPQPSAEELQVADYVFYRTFDVKSCAISDQMDDTVGGLEVKYVFNRRESVRKLDVPNLNSNDKDEERNVIVSAKKLKVAGKDSPQQMNNLKLDENDNRMLEKEDTNVKEVLVERGSLLGEYSSGVDVNSGKNRETAGISIDKETMLGDKNVGCKDSSEKDKFKDIKSPGSQIQVEKRVKSARKSGDLENTQSKKVKKDCTVSLSNLKDINGVQSLSSPGKDEKLSKTSVSLLEETPRSGHAEDLVGFGKDGKLTKDLNSLPGKQSKANDFLPIEKSESAHEKNSVGTQKDKKLGQRERLSIDVASPNGTTRPSPTHVLPNETPKSGSEPEQAAKLVKNLNASMKRPLKASADLSNEKLNTRHDVGHENKDSPSGGRPPKKAKFDDSIKMSEDDEKNTAKKLKDKTCASEIKNPSRLDAYDNTSKSKLGKGASKESFNDKVGKPSKSSLPTPSITTFNGDDGKAEGQIFEVTRRPIVVS
ncbi:hypothetical protein DH2020_001669 [Rehmannia glutinosa]|uniref:Uncharacterized protein n=1 Tax=Rehmannia glutinosa TaxID=99300 RepID=A0ABR0XRV8_REHGL